MGDDTPSCKGMVVMYFLSYIRPQLVCACEMAVLHLPETACKGKEPSGIEPLGKHVAGGVVQQDVVRNLPYAVFKLLQIGRTAVFDAVPVPEDEIPEGKFLLHVFRQLEHQGLGIFSEKTHSELLGNIGNAFLRRLEQDRHIRVILLDHLHKVYPGIRLLSLRRVVAVQHEAHIRNHSQDICLVFLIIILGILIICCKQYLRPGAFPRLALLVIQRLFQELCALQQHHPVKFRQICGIVAHRVLHQQDGLHADFQDVHICIDLILEKLDYRYDKVSVPMPAECHVHGRCVLHGEPAVDFLREMRQQHERYVPSHGLQMVSKSEDILVTHIVHAYHHVYSRIHVNGFPRLGRACHPHELRRVGQVQLDILPVYLAVYLSVLLEYECVIIAAYHQYLPDSEFDQRLIVRMVQFLQIDRFDGVHGNSFVAAKLRNSFEFGIAFLDPEDIFRAGADGLHMDDYVIDLRDIFPDVLFDLAGKGMSLREGDASVSLHIKCNHVFASDAAGAHPVRIAYSFHAFNGFEYLLIDRDILDSVHKFHIGVHEDAYGRADNEAADEKGGNGVEYRHPENKGEEQAGKDTQRDDHIIPHVDTVGSEH